MRASVSSLLARNVSADCEPQCYNLGILAEDTPGVKVDFSLVLSGCVHVAVTWCNASHLRSYPFDQRYYTLRPTEHLLQKREYSAGIDMNIQALAFIPQRPPPLCEIALPRHATQILGCQRRAKHSHARLPLAHLSQSNQEGSPRRADRADEIARLYET